MPDHGSDYYPDDVGGGTSAPESAGEDRDEGAEQTALLPKSILAGKDFKPGDEVVLKVVHIYDDEVEVEYASEPAAAKAKPTPDEEIESMSRQGSMMEGGMMGKKGM